VRWSAAEYHETGGIDPIGWRSKAKTSGVEGDLIECSMIARSWSIVERHHDLVAAAECGDSLQSTLTLRDGHYRTVAVHGVTVRGKIPAPAFLLCLLSAGGGRELGWGNQPGDGNG
jgi:hypothetical protein